MGFLKRLFGGGAARGGDKDGLYFYVRNKRSGEVIQVRLHQFNDLSPAEDEAGFYSRKVIVGRKSFDRIEVEFFFDKNRRFVSADLTGEGELAERGDYDAQQSAAG